MKIMLRLEGFDRIEPTDLCRPLRLALDADDRVPRVTTYSRMRINNLRWLPVKKVFGVYWFGKTVGEYHSASGATPYEFIRGDGCKT